MPACRTRPLRYSSQKTSKAMYGSSCMSIICRHDHRIVLNASQSCCRALFFLHDRRSMPKGPITMSYICPVPSTSCSQEAAASIGLQQTLQRVSSIWAAVQMSSWTRPKA